MKTHFLSFAPTADIDECAESLTSCGAHSQCINLHGSHRCQCHSGFEFGFDGRTCVGKFSKFNEGLYCTFITYTAYFTDTKYITGTATSSMDIFIIDPFNICKINTVFLTLAELQFLLQSSQCSLSM